ncbi:MAG: hypothetical protein FWF77_05565 [Defluviitaleaceae bacterium]|nr:hypothetical protein [Defluviitaleaceae bacterium]
MLVATRSLEAGCSFSEHKKVRQARGGHRGDVLVAARSLEAGCSFLAHEKARFARFFKCSGKLLPASRECVAATYVPGAQCALCALF